MNPDLMDLDAQPAKTPSATALRIPLRIAGGSPAGEQPVTFGVPFPMGGLLKTGGGLLVHAGGTSRPVQLEPLCHWPDGSVRWLRVDVLLPAGLDANGWSLAIGGDEETDSACEQVAVREEGSRIVVETGGAEFESDRHSLRSFAEVRVGGADVGSQPASAVVLTDHKGRRHEAACEGWRVESRGPVRATLLGTGRFRRLRGLRLELRVSFLAGGLVQVDVALHNSRRAKHPGGIWDLGDAGSWLFEDLSVEFAVPKDANDIRYSLERDAEPTSAVSGREWKVYQDSSGGKNWDGRNHVNREGRVPCRFRGYRLDVGDEERSGLRAEPTLQVEGSAGVLSLAYPEFWQQFPKAMEVNGDRMRVGLFPREFGDLHELQGGERKTHSMWVHYGSADALAEGGLGSPPCGVRWVHSSAVVHPEVEWCDATNALPTLGIPAGESRERFETYLDESLSTVLCNRERVDEYGWRNYGDVFADHEEAYYTGDEPLISHYNNQFDMVHGFLLHFLRTGDRRWWHLGDALARHVADIDLYHTTKDKAAYNGGLFWFTDHYLHAHTSSHRTYSMQNRPDKGDYGGGPGAQHNFTSGLLLHYRLTGNAHSRDAVLQLADWVIAMDDGRRTVFGVVDDAPTGLASGSAEYQGPDRAGGNSINALLDAWQLSEERKYIDFAERLIRRCVHPEDDVASLDLLDVEKRWSYTVFLTSLAKYVQVKLEAGATHHSPLTKGKLGGIADYAQASLLRYAEWMVEHERPYFDQAEKLEYPTEAWAAQEFRKANVLRMAARYATEPLRTSLIERGTELADRAWSDLLRFETQNYARAMAIVMIEGLKDCGFREFATPSIQPIAADCRFASREEFVPQRRRIREAVKRPAGVVGMALRGVNPLRWWRYRADLHLSTSPNGRHN